MQKGEGSIVLLIVFVMFMINVKYPFMPPFTNHLNFDGAEKAIIMTREESIQKKGEEADRVARLKKEAEEIRAEYQQAYRDCNGKTWSKLNSAVSIDVQYFFNSYTKTCTKRSAIAQVKKNSNGDDEIYNQVLSTETVFVRSELRDYMLVYRQ